MKRFLAVFLTLCTILCALVSCSSGLAEVSTEKEETKDEQIGK